MDAYALIIAGGVGARFWPRSRKTSPKQLLEIVGSGTMIQNTVFRLDPIVPAERILIVTNEVQAAEIRKQLPRIPEENIIIEPVGRNTAPAITLGAEVLKKRFGNVVMLVLPADHMIRDTAAFQDTLKNAIDAAERTSGLVTIGIKPASPETGYGYIQFNDRSVPEELRESGACPVVTFAEKPNLETARRFLDSGDFLWNSGMFIWNVSTILNNVAEYLPDLSEEFHRLRPAIDTPDFSKALEVAYREMRSISIDYGVMEKAENRFIIPSEFGWTDLGSWDEVYRMHVKDDDGNALKGSVILEDVKNTMISAAPNRVIAAIGVEDLTIIDTDDALLVCRMGRSQEVKEIVDQLRKNNMQDYL